jgi:ethanolamine ammonia-lyase small subunit
MMDRTLVDSLKKTTPARIGVGRAGARPGTGSWLQFRLDHALARDAVVSELSDEFVNSLRQTRTFEVIQSFCADRAEYVLYPPRGKDAPPEALERLTGSCRRDMDVQIVVSDGLSSRAVEANIPDLLPMLEEGLEMEGISVGTLVLARYGRVAIADKIASALGASLVINLIGERPGLSSSISLSAYLTYNPGPHTISSDRTVVSNIHEGGTPPVEAGAYLVQLCKRILNLKLSGVRLQQLG